MNKIMKKIATHCVAGGYVLRMYWVTLSEENSCLSKKGGAIQPVLYFSILLLGESRTFSFEIQLTHLKNLLLQNLFLLSWNIPDFEQLQQRSIDSVCRRGELA